MLFRSAEKVEQEVRLKRMLREIAFLNNKLKAIFPKTKLRALPPKRVVEIKQEVREKGADELARLESELAAIERELGSNKI